MAGSTAVLLMFPVYDGYQATAAKVHHVAALLHKVNIRNTTYYTKELLNTRYQGFRVQQKIMLPQASTPMYYSAPSHIMKAPEYYTESSKFYTIKAPRCNLRHNITIYVFLAHHSDAPN